MPPIKPVLGTRLFIENEEIRPVDKITLPSIIVENADGRLERRVGVRGTGYLLDQVSRVTLTVWAIEAAALEQARKRAR